MSQYQKAFVYYLSIIVALLLINIKYTLQLNINYTKIINTNSYLNINVIYNNYSNNINSNNNYDHNLINVTCDIPNENDKGICVVTTKCSAYAKLKKIPLDITAERVNFLKSVQCTSNLNKNDDDDDSDNDTNTYEPKVCCPKISNDYKMPELPFTSKERLNQSKKINIKKQKRRIQKVQNSLPIHFNISGNINNNKNNNVSQIFNNECGKQITNRIFGGEIAELDEFPWMALLVYNTNEFGCSGTLINKRYILTAAHCVRGYVAREKKGLKYVRLGEFNVRTQPDCIEEKNYLNCADVSLDVPIDKIFVHPDYDEYSKDKINDIALVKLRNTIAFTHFIMPICLPEINATKSLHTGQYLSVSGWGRTDLFNKHVGNIKSPIKLKLKVPIVSKENCTEILNHYGIRLGTKQICAGGESSKDTCAGDSGGPLMYFDRNNSHWVTYGIVSYGFTECGVVNYPAVYTDVSQYIDWILKTITN